MSETRASESRETEPLLGRPGDVTQRSDEGIYRNFFTGERGLCYFKRPVLISELGTASVAQAGIWIVSVRQRSNVTVTNNFLS